MTAGALPRTGTLGGLLGEHARVRSTAAAVVVPRGRRHRAGPAGYRTLTFAELDRRSDAVAAGLLDLGVGAGTRTALLVPPSEELFVVAYALLKAAAVPVLIDPGIGLGKLAACLAEAAPEAFIGVPRAHAARRALRWAPTARTLVVVGPRLPGAGHPLWAVERRGQALGQRGQALGPTDDPAAAAGPSPDPLAAIAFTSGSTGPPKGVEYHQSHFLAQLALLGDLAGTTPGDVNLATFVPFALLGPALGCTTVVPRMDPTRPARVDPARLADAVRTFGAGSMFGSPALLDTVSRWGEATGARLPTLRRVVSAGAPVSRAVQRRTLRMLAPDAEIRTPYGATEALPVTSISSRELLDLPPGGICVGRPVTGVDLAVIGIVDGPLPRLADEDRLPVGQVGEVVVRGPNVTLGYAARPEATARAKTTWGGRPAHRMGDVGYLDEAGRLWYCGRVVHRITTPLGTLFSVPAEEVFNAHPAVYRSAVVGVGQAGAQRPVVWVELEPGVRRSAALARELLALADGDPLTAQIQTLFFSAGLPVDIRHNAKIDREALAGQAARRLAPASRWPARAGRLLAARRGGPYGRTATP